MSSKPLNATEAWLQQHAPELLEEENHEAIAPFVEANDLNGLAHFLEQRITIDQREDFQPHSETPPLMATDNHFHETLDPSEITKEMHAYVKGFDELFKKERLNVEHAADWLLGLLSAELALEEETLYDESPVNDTFPDYYNIAPTKEMLDLAFKCQHYLEEVPGRILPAAYWLTREVIALAKQDQVLDETNSSLSNATSPPMSQAEVEEHAEMLKAEGQSLTEMLEQAKLEVQRIEQLIAHKQEQPY